MVQLVNFLTKVSIILCLLQRRADMSTLLILEGSHHPKPSSWVVTLPAKSGRKMSDLDAQISKLAWIDAGLCQDVNFSLLVQTSSLPPSVDMHVHT